MAPKKAPVEEPPPEPEEPAEPPPPAEGDETELETGLKLPLRANDVGRIWAMKEDYDAQLKMIAQLLGLEESGPPISRKNILCEFHLFNVNHCKTLCLTQRQGAVFHAIMAQILDMVMEPGPKQTSSGGVEEYFKEYERLLLMHSIQDPPARLAIFKGAEARSLSDYASTTLFQHFLLYQSCLRCNRDVQTLRFNVELDRPAPPPDLATARQKQPGKKQPGKKPESQRSSPDAEGDAADGEEKTTGAGGEEQFSEEDDIQRLVNEKLRETEAKLEAKLAEREGRFKEMLAAKKG
jgi:hypothetical protein